MKLVKTYITIAILNWILISAVTLSTSALRDSRHATDIQTHPSEVPVTTAPTPTPQKTVVHVKRVIVLEPTGGSTSSVAVSPDPGVSDTRGAVDPGTGSAPSAPAVSAPTPDTRCIITIDGTRYDVTAFRSMHSGGNIFTCGADMSTVFWSQHGQSTLNRMAQYRI